MEKYAWTAKVVKGKEAEYEKRHAEIWEKMKAVLKSAGIKNYTIWRSGGYSFRLLRMRKRHRIRRKNSTRKRNGFALERIYERRSYYGNGSRNGRATATEKSIRTRLIAARNLKLASKSIRKRAVCSGALSHYLSCRTSFFRPVFPCLCAYIIPRRYRKAPANGASRFRPPQRKKSLRRFLSYKRRRSSLFRRRLQKLRSTKRPEIYAA